MPMIGSRKYPYTAAGKLAAKKAKKRRDPANVVKKPVKKAMKLGRAVANQADRSVARKAKLAGDALGGNRRPRETHHPVRKAARKAYTVAANAEARIEDRKTRQLAAPRKAKPKTPKKDWEPNQIKGMGISAPKPRRTKPAKPRIAKPKPRVKK